MAKVRVGVLGTGDVGRALSIGFASSGHEVVIGSRDPASAKMGPLLSAVGPKGRAATFRDAAASGEVVVLATLGEATRAVIDLAGPDTFAGKIVIDATNPLQMSEEGGPSLSVGHTDSLGERVQRWLPKAKVVKAFNIVGNPLMYRPQVADGPPDMWICGNDVDAKATVTALLHEFGWPSVIDIGGIDGSRYLESLCILWVRSAMAVGNFHVAFRLLQG